MIAFVLRRFLQGILVMLVVGLIAFSLFNYVGDPVSQMTPPEATQADRDAMRQALGLDRPFYAQFATFLANALHGDFGLSLRLGRPVSALLAERLPATLELAFVAALFGLVVGIPLGVYTALKRDTWLARSALTLSLVGISLPNFLIGIFLILIFAVWLGLLPSFGRGDTVQLGFWSTGLATASGLKAIILPAITLGFFPLTLVMRLVRAEMLEVLRADYIKFARARGLTDRAVNFGHALKNTLVPGHHHHGPAAGRHHRVRDHHRAGVPVAGHGPALHPGGAVRRHPGDGGVPVPDRAHLRRDQPGGGPALLRGRPAPAGGAKRRDELMSAVAAFFDSDIFYSFRRRPGVVVLAAGVTLACVVAAVFAPWVAPHDPFDLATLNLLDAFTPPAWTGQGNPHLPAGHRRPGARRALGDHLRLAHVAAGGPARHGARDGRRASASAS